MDNGTSRIGQDYALVKFSMISSYTVFKYKKYMDMNAVAQTVNLRIGNTSSGASWAQAPQAPSPSQSPVQGGSQA